jgi:plastocyanin
MTVPPPKEEPKWGQSPFSHDLLDRSGWKSRRLSEKARKASIDPVGQDVSAAEGQEYTDVMRHFRLMQSLPTVILVLLFLVTLISEDRGYGVMSTVTADDQGIQRATIIMDSYSYSPNELSVEAGKPVELTLRNAATFIPHTFHLADPASGLHVHAEVSAGESQTVRFTPNQRGTFTFYCEKKLLFFKSHRERGQEGRLEVR